MRIPPMNTSTARLLLRTHSGTHDQAPLHCLHCSGTLLKRAQHFGLPRLQNETFVCPQVVASELDGLQRKRADRNGPASESRSEGNLKSFTMSFMCCGNQHSSSWVPHPPILLHCLAVKLKTLWPFGKWHKQHQLPLPEDVPRTETSGSKQVHHWGQLFNHFRHRNTELPAATPSLGSIRTARGLAVEGQQ